MNTLKRLTCAVLGAVLFVVLCACSGVVITIDSVPVTAENGYAFSLSEAGTDGNVYSESTEGYYAPGTEITAHAVCGEDQAFYCWTIGASIDDGGTAVGYDLDYTFSIEEDTALYGNFRDHGSALVLYHANGGTVVETGEDTIWDEFSLDYYLYPNTLAETGVFTREGYTLIGYNTEADGSGEFYNVGGKAFEDTTRVIELYCVWSEQTPVKDFSFEYNRSYSGWFVKSYLGDGGDVSIPTSFEGEPVVGISAGALTGNDSITSLVIPSTILYIEDFSCDSCENLAVLYLFDSLDYLSDDSFSEDEALDTVYFGAATAPRYCNWLNNHAKKVEIMCYWKDADRPMLVCLGGSSTAYAVDAELLESLLDRDYIVLNVGTNGANLFNMTSEWAMHFMDEGDFLVHIAEYSAWQLGGVICRWESYRSFESCYNVFSWVTASQYTDFFDAFCEYLDARRSMTEMSYEDYVHKLAPNGYFGIQGTLQFTASANGDPDFWSGRNIYFCDNWLYSYMIYYVNAQYAKMDAMGVGHVLAFTPLNENSLYDYQTDEGMDDFENYLSENLNTTLISDLQENLYGGENMFDDDYHLSATAREDYTTRLAEDLNEYFATLDAEDTAETTDTATE